MKTARLFCLALCFHALASMAQAADAIRLSTDQARIVETTDDIDQVIVGNAAIADVSVAALRKVAVFGKAAGETSLAALGKDGAMVFSGKVIVVPADDRRLTVIAPAARQGRVDTDYSCAPRCVPVSSGSGK